MKTIDILNLEKQLFTSKESAKEAIKFITNFAGIKIIECDTPKDYITFITLDKKVLVGSGECLYSIWIKNTYDKNDKLIYKISLQIEDSFSMQIAEFINESIMCGELLLTDSMNIKVKSLTSN